MAKEKNDAKSFAKNRKAFHDYFIIDTYETGIVLRGTEVKSIRRGAASLKECYCEIKNGEIWIVGMNVSPYKEGNIFNADPLRKRKLLLHKREIAKLSQEVEKKGFTLTILSLYEKSGRVKAELALCKGKKLFDKRDSEREKEIDNKIRQLVKNNYY